MPENSRNSRAGSTVAGFAIFGCLATGVLGFIGGVLGLLGSNPAGAGVCLIAAALGFGVVAHLAFPR